MPVPLHLLESCLKRVLSERFGGTSFCSYWRVSRSSGVDEIDDVNYSSFQIILRSFSFLSRDSGVVDFGLEIISRRSAPTSALGGEEE